MIRCRSSIVRFLNFLLFAFISVAFIFVCISRSLALRFCSFSLASEAEELGEDMGEEILGCLF